MPRCNVARPLQLTMQLTWEQNMDNHQRLEQMQTLAAVAVAVALTVPALSGCMNLEKPENPSPKIEEITATDRTTYDIAIRNAATEGNKVELLLDGPKTYDAMFDAMQQATDHINLETFILADDIIGNRLADLLIERVQAGVVVNVSYDALGSGMTNDSYFERLEQNGINVLAFRPALETPPWDLLNRNHRKVLVIDGAVGFTGGLNFTRKYRFDSESPPPEERFGAAWRDTHVRIEGPAVADMQRAFLRNWAEQSDNAITPAAYFPEIESAGNQSVLIAVAEGGDTRTSPIFEHYIAAIEEAHKRVWITQAYFIPNDALLDALRAAARRGVDVRLVLPKRTDNGISVPATRSYYSSLLEDGVRIYEYNTSHLHAKTALVDDTWATVGSSNLDMLSYKFNDELNAIMLDETFTHQLAQSFLDDVSESVQITPEDWADRGVWPRVKEVVGRLLQPVL